MTFKRKNLQFTISIFLRLRYEKQQKQVNCVVFFKTNIKKKKKTLNNSF